MALTLRSNLKLSNLLRQACPGIGIRTLKTTTTEHPKPIYDQEDKILKKVIEDRRKDLVRPCAQRLEQTIPQFFSSYSKDHPISLQNPYQKPKRKCILCEQGIHPNYKNVKLLAQFVSPYTGMVYGQHITGLCKEMHSRLENQVKKAIMFGFMPSYIKEVEFLKDPKLCDPERPVRPHSK